jgi:hypothetical protein
MDKKSFHEFDPWLMLNECQRLSQVSFNNTIELARAHNQQQELLNELIQQHNMIVEKLKVIEHTLKEHRRAE